MRRRLVVVVVLVATWAPGAAVASPGTSGRTAPTVETAAELAEVMVARGLDCDPFLDAEDSWTSALHGVTAGDTGECAVRGATASIAVYDSARELRRALEAMPVLCRFVTSVLGPVQLTFVTARNWSVSFFSDEYDLATGRRLGGKVREVDCSKV